jgi:hypothetical protein
MIIFKSNRIHSQNSNWKAIRYPLTFLLSLGFWAYSGIRSAQAAVFSDFTAYLSNSITGFLTAANAPSSVVTLVQAAMGLVPWIVLAIAGGIITWEAIEGYREFKREEYSGMVKPIATILLLVILLYFADRITSALVK